MSTQAGFVGAAPSVKVEKAPPIPERKKYQRVWERAEYRGVAPGELAAEAFLQVAQPALNATVIDFGAGTGRGALKLAQSGLQVTMLDFASNCLDERVRLAMPCHALRFMEHDLCEKAPVTAEYGYCTDVMEHIPPEQVDQVLANILLAAQHVFFQIACEPDVWGDALIGHPLHLSVHPFSWWLKKLQQFDCLVHWSQDSSAYCCFYVTAWTDAAEIRDKGVLNIEEARVVENVTENLKQDWMEVAPHWMQDTEIMILAGGPSLNDHEADIRRLRDAGVKLITTNGTYNWCLERGLVPSAQVVVDARPFNARFTHPVVPSCKYLIASQAHPSVLEGLPKDRTFLWHTGMEATRELISLARPVWYSVPGGSTVTLRAIQLLLMLGYHRMHLFGFDSCLRGDTHHAFPQPENDQAMVIPVNLGGRTFQCHPSMISQAREFMDLVRCLGDEIDLEVYGDGLISHLIRTGAERSLTED